MQCLELISDDIPDINMAFAAFGHFAGGGTGNGHLVGNGLLRFNNS